jgi:hypothetical protein
MLIRDIFKNTRVVPDSRWDMVAVSNKLPRVDWKSVCTINLLYPYKLGILDRDYDIRTDFNLYYETEKNVVLRQLSSDILDNYSLITPYTYSPPAFYDYDTQDKFLLEIKKKVLDNFLEVSGLKTKDLFNWIMFSIPQLYKCSIYNWVTEALTKYNIYTLAINANEEDQKYKVPQNLKEGWMLSADDTLITNLLLNNFRFNRSLIPLTSITSSTTSQGNGAGGQTAVPTIVYKYVPLIEHFFKKENKKRYIFGNKDGTIAVYDDLKPKDKIDYTKKLTEDEMKDIILDTMVIKYHFLRVVDVTYSNNKKITGRTYPYFYAPFGHVANYKFNDDIHTFRNENVFNGIIVSNTENYHYFYCYVHILGIYVQKVFIDYHAILKDKPTVSDYKFTEVDKRYLPYLNKNFIDYVKGLYESLPTNFNDFNICDTGVIDNSVDVEKEMERLHMGELLKSSILQ